MKGEVTMKKPKKEDFHDWCPECKGEGTIPFYYRRGGWAGENVTSQKCCPTCKGAKVWDDVIGYLKAVEKWRDELEKKYGEE